MWMIHETAKLSDNKIQVGNCTQRRLLHAKMKKVIGKKKCLELGNGISLISSVPKAHTSLCHPTIFIHSLLFSSQTLHNFQFLLWQLNFSTLLNSFHHTKRHILQYPSSASHIPHLRYSVLLIIWYLNHDFEFQLP